MRLFTTFYHSNNNGTGFRCAEAQTPNLRRRAARLQHAQHAVAAKKHTKLRPAAARAAGLLEK